MSTIMTIMGKQFTISDETDISENMYDNKNKVMRIVIHDTNKELYNIITAAQLNNKETGTIIFEQKDNKLTLYNPTIVRRTTMEGTQDGFYNYCYIYEIEASKFIPIPVINLGSSKLLVQRLNEYAQLPTRTHKNDAGLDLYSIEDVEIEPFTSILVHTGIAIELPDNTYGQFGNRSSMSKRNIISLGGVIDQGYRGELIVHLYNLDQRVQRIYKGDKVAQLIVIPIVFPQAIEVEKLSTTERGDKGFGSSGR